MLNNDCNFVTTKYIHELPDKKINHLLSSWITVGEFKKKYKAPDWCEDTDELAGMFGCFTLLWFGNRRIRKPEDCSNCACYHAK